MWLFSGDVQAPCLQRAPHALISAAILYTAKTQYREFETNIPRKGIAWPQSPFMFRSAYPAAAKYMDRSSEYINCSKTNEYGYWDQGRAIPFLGIHKWDFRCSVGRCNHKIYAVLVSRKRIHFDSLLTLLKLPPFGVKSKKIKLTKDIQKSLRLGSYLFKESAAIVCLFEVLSFS